MKRMDVIREDMMTAYGVHEDTVKDREGWTGKATNI